MLECLKNRVRDLNPRHAQGRRLSVVPIVGPAYDVPEYQLLTETNFDKVRVSEISDAGSVPVLRVSNSLDVRVFLMDGQELVGAKQNRILNTDVLVAPHGTLDIPVSCVEQGRWRPATVHFSPGKAASHRTRSGKSRRVHAALKENRGHDANQHAVWDEVACTLRESGSQSDTQALAAAYEQREQDLAAFRSEVQLPEGTVGVAVFHRGEFLGLDLFDRPSTLNYFWSALADSYAIDVISQPLDPHNRVESEEASMVKSILDTVAGAKWESFRAPGEGIDWRLEDPTYTGSALAWEDRSIIHLQLFARPVHPEAPPHWRPRIRRPYGSR